MTAVSPFCKRKDDLLIELVRANPILYDSHHDHFRHFGTKHQIWESISEELDIPLVHVKKRWRHFRDHYLKKRRQYAAGSAHGKLWEYMPQLEFLAYTRDRELRLDGAGAADEEAAPSDESDAEPARRRPRPEPRAPAAGEGAARRAPPADQPALHKFFESMADIVAQFPPRLAAETRLRVCQLVTDMEMRLQAGGPGPVKAE